MQTSFFLYYCLGWTDSKWDTNPSRKEEEDYWSLPPRESSSLSVCSVLCALLDNGWWVQQHSYESFFHKGWRWWNRPAGPKKTLHRLCWRQTETKFFLLLLSYSMRQSSTFSTGTNAIHHFYFLFLFSRRFECRCQPVRPLRLQDIQKRQHWNHQIRGICGMHWRRFHNWM